LPISSDVGRPDVTATFLPSTKAHKFSSDRIASRFAGPIVMRLTGNDMSTTWLFHASNEHAEIMAHGGTMFCGEVTTCKPVTSVKNAARSSNAVLNKSV
jgi:hypothetical protein